MSSMIATIGAGCSIRNALKRHVLGRAGWPLCGSREPTGESGLAGWSGAGRSVQRRARHAGCDPAGW